MPDLFSTLNPQDVIWVNYPYEDDATKRKRRPAVIIDKDNNNYEVVVVKVTSQPPRDDYDYEIIEWTKALLKKPSVARASKIEVIAKDDILSKIGTLDAEDFKEIIRLINEYISKNN